ncbi:hypothetical protein LG3211_3151 [Lysobacter gummosus]|nr:hypothetical protein LG3211_3151 [Lysobacter gummosus]
MKREAARRGAAAAANRSRESDKPGMSRACRCNGEAIATDQNL